VRNPGSILVFSHDPEGVYGAGTDGENLTVSLGRDACRNGDGDDNGDDDKNEEEKDGMYRENILVDAQEDRL